MEPNLFMSIMCIVMLILIAVLRLLYLRDNDIKDNRISELESSLHESREICDELKESNTKLTDELAKSRQDIWDYEVGTLEPGLQVKVKDMKSYIIHLLQKQNVVLGINDEDKAWLKRLGVTVEGDTNE